MVYYKRRYTKRYNGGSRYRVKRGYRSKYKKATNSVAKKVNWLVKQNKINRPELKHYDITHYDVDIADTYIIYEINNARQGYSTIKSLYLKYNCTVDSSCTEKRWFRFVIFMDKAPEDGVTPSWSEIYKETAGLKAINSMRYLDDEDVNTRYKIMMDRKFFLINNTAGTVKDSIVGSYYKKMNLEQLLDGSETPMGQKNNLYLMIMSTCDTGECSGDMDWRVTFIPKSS